MLQLATCGDREFHGLTGVLVLDPFVITDFHEIFKLGINDHHDGMGQGRGEFEIQTNVAHLHGMEMRGVDDAAGGEIEPEDGLGAFFDSHCAAILVHAFKVAPHVSGHEAGDFQMAGGIQKASPPFGVFVAIGTVEFEFLFERVLFAVDGHAHHGAPKLLEAIGVSEVIPIVGVVVDQTHKHAHGDPLVEQLVLVDFRQPIGHGKGAQAPAQKKGRRRWWTSDCS